MANNGDKAKQRARDRDPDTPDGPDSNEHRPAKRLYQRPVDSSASKTHLLDGFITSSRPNPKPTYVTGRITDRDSIFKALVFKATCSAEVERVSKFVQFVYYASDPEEKDQPTHNISAWRFLTLKRGADGLNGPGDYQIQSGFEDDGEKWAGGKVLKVMEEQGTIDAVVVVSRWYGGVMLGPARFRHIECCALDACKAFKSLDAIEDDITILNQLDCDIVRLRLELKDLTAQSLASLTSSPPNQSSSRLSQTPASQSEPTYDHLKEEVNRGKSKNLIAAREKTIALLKKMIQKEKDKKLNDT